MSTLAYAAVTLGSRCPRWSPISFNDSPSANRWVAQACLLCRMRHRRHYAASRTMPHVEVSAPIRSMSVICVAA